MGLEQFIAIGLCGLGILNGWIMLYVTTQARKIEDLNKKIDGYIKQESEFRVEVARTYATRDSFDRIFEAMEAMRTSINERLDRVIDAGIKAK